MQTPPRPRQAGTDKRDRLADRIADALLEAGVAQIPLRDLAHRLGTSDRMLLYYFETQADLVGAALQRLSDRLATRLEALSAGPPRPPAELYLALSVQLADPAIAPTLRVWADVAARGARGEAAFRRFAGVSAAAWTAWLAERLDVADEDERRLVAAAILVALDGARAIELSAPGATAGVPALLARAFRR